MTNVTSKPPTIARILDVRDTRDRIEVGDRWVAVPGTGIQRPCDRCGREHEIHVDVELSDGRRANIGLGCAKGESMEVQGRLKSAVSAAKTRSKLRAELAVAQEELATAAQAWREVEALPAPTPELLEEIPVSHGTRQDWGMGDAQVWTLGGTSSTPSVARRSRVRGGASATVSVASSCRRTATSCVSKTWRIGWTRSSGSSRRCCSEFHGL